MNSSEISVSAPPDAGSASVPSDSPIPIPQSAIPNPESFPRRPGETPRAFSAFTTYFQLGHARSLQSVADKLGENLGTVKNWSAKYDWSDRLQAYHAGILQEHAQDQALLHRQQLADWNRRLSQFREQEWEAAQKLIVAAHCFLESFGEDDLRRMTLSQAARALKVSSAMARSALTGSEFPADVASELSPIQQQLLAGVSRVYGDSPQSPDLKPST